MNPSRIEQAIDEIYNYVENCKPSKLYPSKAVVERGELYDLLDELRMCAPEEIKRYQKIIHNRDGILSQAQQEADAMLAQAREQTAQLLDQNEIVQTAYQRAEGIMNQATKEAQEILNAARQECEQMRRASLVYTNDLLTEAERGLNESLREMDNKYRMLNSAMKNSLQVIRNNKEELASQLNPKAKPDVPQEEQVQSGQGSEVMDDFSAGENKQQQEKKDDFNVPESAFLKNVEDQR